MTSLTHQTCDPDRDRDRSRHRDPDRKKDKDFTMSFSHQKLDVYRLSLEYIRWVYGHADDLTGIHRHARDQLLRASQSIPLSIAEGNGKFTAPDRGRYFGIARGSALECAAIQDVLLIGGAINQKDHSEGVALLLRVVAMLTKMARRSESVREAPMVYDASRCDPDCDPDPDHDQDYKEGE